MTTGIATDRQRPRTFVWNTSDVERRDRFDYYREAICESFMTLAPEAPAARRNGFEAKVAHTPISDGALNHVQATSHQVNRTRHEIAASQSACFYLNLQQEGECRISQLGTEISLTPGRVGLFRSDEPFTLHHDRFSHLKVISMRIPRESLCGRTGLTVPDGPVILSDDPFSGHLVRETIATLANATGLAEAGELERLYDILLDLVAVRLSSEVADTPRDSRVFGKGLYLAIVKAMAEKLHDPELSAGRMARQFGISLRYLHKLFEESGGTFSERLYDRRLEAAARDLRDIDGYDRSITEIAHRWGFRDHAHFSRRFRERFLTTPTDWRRQSG